MPDRDPATRPPSRREPALWPRLRAAASRTLPKTALDLWHTARALDRETAKRNRRFGRIADDGLPIPGVVRLVAVAGTADIAWFLESGQRAADVIAEALARHGTTPRDITSLLDFGCGCGRVVRRWRPWSWVETHGCDIDMRAIRWCRRNLPFAAFRLNHIAPPLPYADASFDLVYALSVFTHTTEALQTAWMKDIRRVLRPGGSAVITTHGTRYADALDSDERAAFDAGRLVVRHAGSPGTNRCGAYHPVPYVRDVLARGFEVLEHVPEGALGNPDQDLWLLRRHG